MSFYTDADTDLYLSLIESGIKTKVINRALRDFMQREALVDLDDGKHPTRFWNLPVSTKNQLLKELGGQGDGKADEHIWILVQETTPQDFYQWAAKYLALHQLKFGRPYVLQAAVEPKAPPLKLRKHFHEKKSTEIVSAALKSTTVTLYLRVENNNKFVRGKKKAREDIEDYVLRHFQMKKLRNCDYELTFSYEDDKDLENQIHHMLLECANFADMRHCFTESDVREIGTERYW
ncbi:MAG: hypothetical protein K2X81_28975 [Candidatus Obscuribacterales bacterium]|nr:hypothetical protein [Candidatus Obscuribacterales bacterium]